MEFKWKEKLLIIHWTEWMIVTFSVCILKYCLIVTDIINNPDHLTREFAMLKSFEDENSTFQLFWMNEKQWLLNECLTITYKICYASLIENRDYYVYLHELWYRKCDLTAVDNENTEHKIHESIEMMLKTINNSHKRQNCEIKQCN